jgi:dipeptidyl aminopeptidase/acylaminoacyl peptidase
MQRAIAIAAVALAAAALPCPAQRPADQLRAAAFDLSIENLMRGPELYGTAPSRVRFSDDSRHVYFRWKKPDADTAEAAYRVAVAGGEPERLTQALEDSLYPQPGVWSRDRRLKVYVRRGDVWLWDAARAAARRLTETPGAEGSPQLSADGRTAFFVREDNVYAIGLDGGPLVQLTDVRRGNAPRPADRDSAGQRGLLRAQQRDLFEFVRRPPRETQNPFSQRPDTTALPRPLFLAESQSLVSYSVSPDGRYLLFTQSERPAGQQVQALPVWVTGSGYIETPPNRTKVGDEQTITKAGILEFASGAVNWVDPGLGSRGADLRGIGWAPTGRLALVSGFAHDDTDRWLWVVDVPGFQVRQLDVLHDSAWVGGLSRGAGWLPDGETVWFTSEATGWAHLYTVPAAGGPARALTSGPWEVEGVQFSPDGRRVYFQSSEVHWGERHLYTAGLDGGARTQLTRGEGRHDVVPSPDGRWLAILHSTANHPPELYLQPNRPGAAWRQVTESTTEEFRRYPWRVPELVSVPSRDGTEVPGQLFRPAGAPNGAAVVFVHGAGYLQDVHKWWSDYPREYLFHHFLAARGYTVLELDYRASAGHGRDWRTAIYRHMGGTDLDDNVDGARWLVRTQGVDSARIGVYGGSYGGFITLMAMFTTPGVFRAGAALRPVTDWAHYSHGYTAAILNTPQEDSAAYRRSSPIYFAEGLRGALLICHGMVDDNVNFQDAVRLVQRLIELRKEDWELAVYPVEPHGFRMTTSWIDEYRRIFRLFEVNLNSGATGPARGGG